MLQIKLEAKKCSRVPLSNFKIAQIITSCSCKAITTLNELSQKKPTTHIVAKLPRADDLASHLPRGMRYWNYEYKEANTRMLKFQN